MDTILLRNADVSKFFITKGTSVSLIRLLCEVNGLQFDYLKTITGGLDRNAVLEDLMDAYGQDVDVWNFAYFLTGRAPLADDIAQDFTGCRCEK